MTKDTEFWAFQSPGDFDLAPADEVAAVPVSPIPDAVLPAAPESTGEDLFHSMDLLEPPTLTATPYSETPVTAYAPEPALPPLPDLAPAPVLTTALETDTPVPAPAVESTIYVPVPEILVSTIAPSTTEDNPFMAAGDLLGVAEGHHAEKKGQHWDEYTLTKKVTVIGRAARCDLSIKQSGISLEHARISRQPEGFVLTDSRSQAGTYVNGVRIDSPVLLKEKDQIAFGSSNYVFASGKLIYSKADDPETRSAALRTMAPTSRPVVLRTDIRSKRVKNHSGNGTKELIRDIRLEVKEGSLVAMLGTAGAGKSTVMNCMNGMELQGVTGSVMYRNVDLVHNFAQMKHLIGSVPQKKIFHPTFTPEEEFMQAAMLRLPADTTQREIKERVNKTLEMLSITDVRKSRNSKLSGGEQTRVNVGIELVADRDLLCLDEPDQGLSPNYKHELFTILQNLAHNHCKTVISIIHDVSEINMFDQVIILTKVGGVGRLAYSGSPAAAQEHFGVEIRDVYSLLEREPERFIK